MYSAGDLVKSYFKLEPQDDWLAMDGSTIMTDSLPDGDVKEELISRYGMEFPEVIGRTLPASASWYSATYGNGKFVAVAAGGTTAAYSTDGIIWTASTMPSSASWRSVTYGDGKFVAVAYNSNKTAYSTDGITWTASTLPSPSSWFSVTYGNGKFVTVANGGTTAAYSTDGITWTASTMPSSASWYSATYGNGKFVTVANNSTTAASIEFKNIINLPIIPITMLKLKD